RREVGIELAQLVAIDRNIGLARGDLAAPAPGPEKPREQQRGEQRREDREEDHSSSFAARARSASESSGGSGAFRFILRNNRTKPNASSMNGPAQRSTVLALSGGR